MIGTGDVIGTDDGISTDDRIGGMSTDEGSGTEDGIVTDDEIAHDECTSLVAFDGMATELEEAGVVTVAWLLLDKLVGVAEEVCFVGMFSLLVEDMF